MTSPPTRVPAHLRRGGEPTSELPRVDPKIPHGSHRVPCGQTLGARYDGRAHSSSIPTDYLPNPRKSKKTNTYTQTKSHQSVLPPVPNPLTNPALPRKIPAPILRRYRTATMPVLETHILPSGIGAIGTATSRSEWAPSTSISLPRHPPPSILLPLSRSTSVSCSPFPNIPFSPAPSLPHQNPILIVTPLCTSCHRSVGEYCFFGEEHIFYLKDNLSIIYYLKFSA